VTPYQRDVETDSNRLAAAHTGLEKAKKFTASGPRLDAAPRPDGGLGQFVAVGLGHSKRGVGRVNLSVARNDSQ
jgi:hypothetical protein